MIKNDISFNKENNSITITYAGFGHEGRKYSDFLDWCSSVNGGLVTAQEVEDDAMIYDGYVYLFDFGDKSLLMSTGKVELESNGLLEDYIDKDNSEHVDFLGWYKGE